MGKYAYVQNDLLDIVDKMKEIKTTNRICEDELDTLGFYLSLLSDIALQYKLQIDGELGYDTRY